uniref:VWFD domain-containing protein n=1 Tax=Calidris pygmaea TaxID=425635 RepID=A0A8C3JSS2_9CHAR
MGVSHVACACHHAGRRHPPGQRFWEGGNCSRSCLCDPRVEGGVRCWEEGCRRGERCGVEKGVTGCYPESYGTCSSGGDLRYVTFDGGRYDLPGGRDCLYQLAGTCGASEGLVGFQVWVQKVGQGGPGPVPVTSVQVIVYGYNVTLSSDFPGRAMVREVPPPTGSRWGFLGGGG